MAQFNYTKSERDTDNKKRKESGRTKIILIIFLSVFVVVLSAVSWWVFSELSDDEQISISEEEKEELRKLIEEDASTEEPHFEIEIEIPASDDGIEIEEYAYSDDETEYDEADDEKHSTDYNSRPSRAESVNDGYNTVLSKRKLSSSDLDGKTKKELEIMRNSIYARYGYKFKREDLLNHFSQYSWYNPSTSDMASVYNQMSSIEKYNVEFIKKHE
jgi:hypothetical protein